MSGVCASVCVQGAGDGEALVTVFTSVRFHSGVCSHVSLKRAALSEPPTTHATLKCFLTRVNSEVHVERAFRGEAFVTMRAFVRPMSSVAPSMDA